MKKIIISLLIIFLFINNNVRSQAGLRDAVVVVRPVYSSQTLEFLNDFSSSLREYGYYSTAEIMDVYAKGGFGSGFIYKNEKDGKFYVITNRHVVAQAENVKIEVLKSGKDKKTYDKCNVLLAHRDLDLALIELPSDIEIHGSLQFSSQEISEGSTVFSAGFPGLGADPSWQLGKGIISNSELISEDLTDNVSIGLIQHTAQVDPGSSGGPLLFKNENSALGYDVIGINTWKASNRERVNISIPAQEIINFINIYNENEEEFSEESLKKSIDDFILASKSGYKNIIPFVSYDYTRKFSVKTFNELLNSGSKEVNNKVKAEFAYGSPIEGLRIGLAEKLYENLSSKELSFLSIENFNTSGEPVTVLLDDNGKKMVMIWKIEEGQWRFKDVSTFELSKINKGKIGKSFDYDYTIKIEAGLPMNEYAQMPGIVFGGTFTQFVIIEFALGIWKMNSSDDSSIGNVSKDGRMVFDMLLRGGPQVPIKLSTEKFIIPYVKGEFGFNTSIQKSSSLMRTYGFLVGADFAIPVGINSQFLIGLAFRQRFFGESKDDYSKEISPKSMAQISIGFAF